MWAMPATPTPSTAPPTASRSCSKATSTRRSRRPRSSTSLDRLVVWLASKYRVAAGKISGSQRPCVDRLPGQAPQELPANAARQGGEGVRRALSTALSIVQGCAHRCLPRARNTFGVALDRKLSCATPGLNISYDGLGRGRYIVGWETGRPLGWVFREFISCY